MAGRNWGKARSLCEETSLGPGGTGYGGGAGECATTTTSPRPHSDPSKQREPRGRQGNAASLPAAQRSNPVAASLVASFVLVIKRKEKVRGSLGPWEFARCDASKGSILHGSCPPSSGRSCDLDPIQKVQTVAAVPVHDSSHCSSTTSGSVICMY